MKKITLLIFFIGFILIGCKAKTITKKYTVTFHENGGSVVEDAIVDANTKITLPIPNRVGFTFIGWNDGNGNILNGEIIVARSQELYAEWDINTYTVTFTDDEGNILATEEVQYNKNATLPPIPQKDGFAFVGWDKDHNNITSDVTIKAIFTKATNGLIFEKDIDNYIVTGYEGLNEKVIIPYRYNGLPVTKIGEAAFYDNYQIKEVILPDTIEVIGKNAFARCSALEKINFPTSIITIEESAFQQATNLSEVNINAKVIGLKAFYGSNNITSIVLNEGIIEIGELAFHSCSITEIYIPTSVDVIGNGAFNWCQKLKEIKTPYSNVEKLENLIQKAKLIYTSPKVVGIN